MGKLEVKILELVIDQLNDSVKIHQVNAYISKVMAELNIPLEDHNRVLRGLDNVLDEYTYKPINEAKSWLRTLVSDIELRDKK